MSGVGAELAAFRATAAKEWQILRRYPLNLIIPLIWAIVLPYIYVGEAYGFSGSAPHALAVFAGRAGTTQIPAFLYLGWTVYLWIATVLWGPGTAVRMEKMQGTLEPVLLTRTSAVTILFGPVPAYLVSAAGVFAVAALTLKAFFAYPLTAGQLIRSFLVIMAATPILLALGALFSAVSVFVRDFTGLAQAIQGLLTVLCGITYPLAVLPGWARAVSQTLPPTHIVDGLRTAALASGGLSAVTDQIAWLLAAAVGIGVVAILIMRMTLAAARVSGRMGMF
jgi:ABC-2 type transport system permease protein